MTLEDVKRIFIEEYEELRRRGAEQMEIDAWRASFNASLEPYGVTLKEDYPK